MLRNHDVGECLAASYSQQRDSIHAVSTLLACDQRCKCCMVNRCSMPVHEAVHEVRYCTTSSYVMLGMDP